MQFRAPTALTPTGNARLVHVNPPSLLTQAGAAVPVSDTPPTTQSDPFEQEIALRVEDLAGVTTEDHVAPPSFVATSKAPALRSVAPDGFDPIATQTVADAHETERSTPVPPLTNLGVHVWPLSLLTRIWAPTATQKEVLGQSTDPKAPTFGGRVGVTHVLPPSEDTSTWPP